MVSCSWRLLCAALCLTGARSLAKAQEPAAAKRLALAVYEKGSPDRGVVDGFLAALAEIDWRAPSIAIVGGREPGRPLEGGRADSVLACGANIRCIAAVGDEADATHVLLGRATGQADHVSMQWLLVDASTARIVGKFLANLTDAASARAAAAEMAGELLGVTAAEMAEPPAGMVASLRPDRAAAASRSGTPQQPTVSHTRVLIGISAIASGMVVFSAGVYLGQRSHATGDGFMHGPGGGSLVAAPETQIRARADAKRASVLFTMGGLLVAGGAGALWTSRWMDVTPVISIDADARVAGVSGSW